MAATLIGTPTAIIWASGADPAGQNITIPADCTAVYMFWMGWFSSANSSLATATLNGNNPSESIEQVNGQTGFTQSGLAVWYNPATGSQTLDISWDNARTEGPICIVAYVKDGDTTGWRDAGVNSTAGSTANSVTINSSMTDLVLKFDGQFLGSVPSTSSGWTSQQTTTNNSEGGKLSSANSPGASTTVCNSENENYSTITAVSIIAGASAVYTPPGIMVPSVRRYQHMLVR